MCSFVLALATLCGCASHPTAGGAGKLPFGALDTPADGDTVQGTTFINGWALSEDGVDHVEIYLDRTLLKNAVMKGKREDVIRVFPEFATVEDVKFQSELKVESIPAGLHELSARVVSRKQQTRDLIPHKINIVR